MNIFNKGVVWLFFIKECLRNNISRMTFRGVFATKDLPVSLSICDSHKNGGLFFVKMDRKNYIPPNLEIKIEKPEISTDCEMMFG